MKRRTFNKYVLATLFSTTFLPAMGSADRNESTTLTCLRRPAQTNTEGVFQNTYALTIGIGDCGSNLANELHATVDPSHEAFIYTERFNTRQIKSDAWADITQVPLKNVHSGVFIIALNEPESRPLALAWARRMREAGVDLTTAILCIDDITSAITHAFTAELKNQVDSVILQVGKEPNTKSLPHHPAVNSARLFFMEQGLIGWDFSDLQSTFKGRMLLTTTSPFTSSSNAGEAVKACYQQLHGVSVDGGVGHWVVKFDDLCLKTFSDIDNHLQSLPIHDSPILTASADLIPHPESEGSLHMIWSIS